MTVTRCVRLDPSLPPCPRCLLNSMGRLIQPNTGKVMCARPGCGSTKVDLKMRRGISPGKRFRILRRDAYTCRWCGRSAPDVTLHVDHILPVNAGGSDAETNLVTSCQDCNLGKSDILSDHPHAIRHLWSSDQYLRIIGSLRAQADEISSQVTKLEAEWVYRYGRPEAI